MSRELIRNQKYGRVYLPSLAQKRAEREAERQRYQAPLKSPEIFLYVREHLREGWSPETIAGCWRKSHSDSHLHHETIYQYIYHRRNRRESLWLNLTLARKKRRFFHGRKVRRGGPILNPVSIDLRPKAVIRRKQPGHWETDNMEGVRSDRIGVSVLTERVSRVVLLSRLSSHRAEAKTQALVGRLKELPALIRRTITADNGSENSQHLVVAQSLNLNFYFCHPYHAWEKGTVENTVGRVRRYLPKGISLAGLSEEHLRLVEIKMNNTPRKCLDYLTPYEKMEKILGRMRNTRGKTA